MFVHICFEGKVYFWSQILDCLSIGECWNISGVLVLPENVMFTSLEHASAIQAHNTGKQKCSRVVQYMCTSIWDLKYAFSFWELLHFHDHAQNFAKITVHFGLQDWLYFHFVS